MTNAVTIAQQGSNNTTFRNRIINGAMVIDQRASGATTTVTADAYVTCDRWKTWSNASSKFSIARSSTAPAGFNYSLLATSLSAYTPSAGDYFFISQQIEGYNFADMAWGTSSAKTITLSFWVRSSLTGTFGGGLENNNGDRSYPFTYTISSANTWEQKTVTVAGDTTGTWVGATNSYGVYLWFGLGCGSTRQGAPNTWQAGNYPMPTGMTQVVGTNGATFYITGVQLEAGSAASPFEYRSYGTELALCQRYYYRNSPGASNSPLGAGTVTSGTAGTGITQFPVAMRTAPTALEQTGTAADYNTSHAGSTYVNNAVPTFVSANTYIANTQFTNGGTMISGGAVILRTNSTSGYLGWSAEL